MANVLTLEMRADASKMRGDLAVADAAVRDLKKQLNAAAKESLATGERGAVDKLADDYEKAAAHASKLKNELNAVGLAHHEVTRPLHEVGKALHEVGSIFGETLRSVGEGWEKLKESFSNMGEHLFGEHFKAAVALGVGASVAGLYELVHSSAEAADEVEKSAMSVGLGIKAYQGLRYAAIQAGVSTDEFATAFARMSRQVEAGAQAQRGALIDVGKMLYGQAMAGGPTVLRGGSQTQEGGATVLRGGAGAGNVGPGFTTVLPDTVRRVSGFAKALKTALDQAGVGVGFTVGQISQSIAMLAESTGKQADQLRAKLREFGVALQPRTIADALDNLSMTWTEKLGQIVNTIDPATMQIRSLDDIIADLADKFRAMPDGAEKTALAVRLFGRAGAQLIPFLDRGSKGIADWRREFERLGIAFDENQTKIGRQAVEAFETLKIAMEGAKNQFALVFDPIFTPLINQLTLAIAKNADTLKGWARDIADQVQPVIDDLIHMLRGEDNQVQNRWLLQMRDWIVEFAAGVRKAWPAIKGFFTDLHAVLHGVAVGLNYVFGTDFNAASIGILLTLGKLIGVFGFLRSAIGLTYTTLKGLTLLIVGIGRLLVAPAIMAGINAIIAGFTALGEVIAGFALAVGLPIEAVAVMAAAIVVAIGAAVAAIVIYRDQIAAAFDWAWQHVKTGAIAAWKDITLGGKTLLTEFWAIGKSIQDAFLAVFGAIQGAFSALVAGIEAGIRTVMSAIAGVVDAIGSAAQSLASLLGAAGSSVGAAAAGTTAGFARGGLVRGGGSSTSDSIPARLSNGEFVMSARAVSNLGVGTLHALNGARGFALGGLVTLPGRLERAPLRLAGGGLVRAGGGHGATINLTIGGESFRGLSAPDEVAAHMQRFARGRQMTAGGTKPSWYGS